MYHLLLIVTAAVLMTPVSLGQENEKKEVHVNKFVPSSFKKLTDDLTLDLTAEAQSYFIEPELPSSTTVKPTFKRRKTLRPISSLTEKKTSRRPSSEDDPESARPPSPPFNPFRQIVNTGFAKKRPSPQRPSSGVGEEAYPNADLNNNHPEVNDIRTTTPEGIPEQTTPREVLRRKKNKSAFGTASAPAPPQIKLDSRPNRFLSPRRPNVNSRSSLSPDFVTPSTVPVSSSAVASESPAVPSQSTLSTSAPPAFRPNRGGRQGGGFVLRPKQIVLTDAAPSTNDEGTKPIRRRKKPSSETPTSVALSADQNETEPKEPTQSDVGTGRKIPSGLQRRPTSYRTKLPKVVVSEPPVDLLPRNFPLEGRGRGPARAPLADSVHESSDTVNAAVLSPEGEALDTDALSNATPIDVTSDVNYRPRNLSNRNANPLDKLSNRQAAARRFLTPKDKKPEESATLAPVVQKPFSVKKTPFSLQNLRSRRLGPAGATSTSTTEASVIEEVASGEQEAPGNSTAAAAAGSDDAGALASREEKKPVEGEEEGEGPKELKEASLPTPPALPGKRRPPVLPGGRKPLVPRAPNRKVINAGSTTTTEKPAQETTPTPACEDGKKYNKILRKCIPSYAPRSG